MKTVKLWFRRVIRRAAYKIFEEEASSARHRFQIEANTVLADVRRINAHLAENLKQLDRTVALYDEISTADRTNMWREIDRLKHKMESPYVS